MSTQRWAPRRFQVMEVTASHPCRRKRLHLFYPYAASVLRGRLSRRRSRSLFPPQMPNASLWSSAYSRHSDLTAHPAHMARAAFDEPQRSGKNIASDFRIGSSAHLASSCQSTGVSGITSPSVPQRVGAVLDFDTLERAASQREGVLSGWGGRHLSLASAAFCLIDRPRKAL